jgi:hypothetical protein
MLELERQVGCEKNKGIRESVERGKKEVDGI